MFMSVLMCDCDVGCGSGWTCAWTCGRWWLRLGQMLRSVHWKASLLRAAADCDASSRWDDKRQTRPMMTVADTNSLLWMMMLILLRFLLYMYFSFCFFVFVDFVFHWFSDCIFSCVSLGLLYCYGFSPGFNFDFLNTSQEIVAGKSVSDMSYLVSSGTLNINSIKRICNWNFKYT